MTSILKSIFPTSSSKKSDEDEFDVEYSIAVEYSGPPVSYDIPQVAPVVLQRIPTATMVASASISNSRILSLPVIQPIVKRNKDHSNHKGISKASESSPTKETHFLNKKLGSLKGSDEDLRGESVVSLGSLYGDEYATKGFDCIESSGTLGFSDNHEISGSSGVLSIEEADECDVTTSDSDDEDEDEDEVVNFPEKSLVTSDSKKCFRCHKGNRLIKKEACLVCGVKYCDKCVLRAMGSMPEGRKCTTCIGYRINETKRGSLGKCSRLLKSLFTYQETQRIMELETSCKANQLPSNLVTVNGKHLSPTELFILKTCPHPPKKLKPGRYWYDQVSGFWGKEGEKPCQIISDQLAVGETMKRDASNGNTDVLINGREITLAELRMLKMIGIHCEQKIHFWLQADGSYQQEGMKNVMGKLWEKTGINLVCAAFSLPTPPKPSTSSRQEIERRADIDVHSRHDQRALTKLLLVGCDRSGTTTIFKQAKIQYDVPFKEDERESVKCMIQSNLYKYISILLEGRDQFEKDYRNELRQKCLNEPGPSVIPEEEEENIYSISPRLKVFADWLLEVRMLGNLEAIFPAATRVYAPLVEELWKDKAFLATYQRRNELHMLPRVANYFLDRAVEISRDDYEPSSMDILYAEGCASANGVASMEFSLSEPSKDSNSSLKRCELIRVHASSLGENCKLLEMFEDTNVVLYTVSLTDYSEILEDGNGALTNKMMESKKLFERIVTHPSFAQKHFLLLLNKFDLLEELIVQFPLDNCEWFRDFNPMSSHNRNNNLSLAQFAFHYIAAQFKGVYKTLTGRKLYVSQLTGLEGESVHEALKYASEILRWEEEKHLLLHDWATESTEVSTTM